jgi:hypothetical protein
MEVLLPSWTIILWLILLLFGFLLWIAALVHVLKSQFADSTQKLIWVLVVCLLPLLGSLLYFSLGRKGITKLNQQS